MSKPLITVLTVTYKGFVSEKNVCCVVFVVVVFFFILTLKILVITFFVALALPLLRNSQKCYRCRLQHYTSSSISLLSYLNSFFFHLQITNRNSRAKAPRNSSSHALQIWIVRLLIGKGYAFPHGLSTGILYTRSRKAFMSRPVKPLFLTSSLPF